MKTNMLQPTTDGGDLPREWITIEEACRYAGVSKPTVYGWMSRGMIRNFSNRQRGQVRGVRRVSFDSLRQFMLANSTGGSGQ